MAEPNKASSGQTILQKIVQQRHLDVAEAKQRVPFDEIRRQADASPFALVSFPDRLKQNNWTSVLAEVKRASPSKGDIAPGINAAEQALRYAKAGAAAISCLTEPTWFKGTLEDLKSIREGAMS
jgi:anthranilate synthase / indole-3-glycerol phosphate synthase / phosphoribosylanthranilate isomerase